MKLTIEKIRTYNSVIQFIVLVLFCAFILVEGVLFVIHQIPHAADSGIKIVTEATKTEIKKSVKYSALLRDNYVFALESNAIAESEMNGLQKSVASYERSTGNKEIVNFYFVSSENKKETTLLKQNSLIVSHHFINDTKSAGLLIDKNIFAIVSADTNKDNRLSIDDAVTLYVSDYNGINLEKIGEDVYGYQIIDDDTILFTEILDGKQLFKTYNSKTRKTDAIKTADDIPDHKEFDQIFY